MSYEFEGRLKKILPIKERGTFKKIEFILVSDEQYPQMIKFELQNNKIKLIESFFIGDQIKLDFNLRGIEWLDPEGKKVYFTSFTVWRLKKIQNGYVVPTKESPDQRPQYNINFPPAEDVFGKPNEVSKKYSDDYDQDLPF